MTAPAQFGLIFQQFVPCEQMKRVVEVLERSQEQWLTLGEIKARTLELFGKLDSEAGVSARIRQLKFMGLDYEKRTRGNSGRLYEYRLRRK